MVNYLGPVSCGLFVKRVNRFLAEVNIDGEKRYAHVPNTGRMLEILTPERLVVCSFSDLAHRKTEYTLFAARMETGWINIDSRNPNKLLKYLLQNSHIPGIGSAVSIKHEVTFGTSRLDLAISTEKGNWLVENKCCTLIKDGIAAFPDAPTQRGAKHIYELKKAVTLGFNAAIFFIVQFQYAFAFRPNDITDPVFARALREANEAGVKIFAYNCFVDEKSVKIYRNIPVII